MLPVDANREEIDLIAPKVFKTFNKRSCLEVGLNIPRHFQRDSLSGLCPVMDNQTSVCCQIAAHRHFELLATVLEQPRIDHPPAADKPNAIVLP